MKKFITVHKNVCLYSRVPISVTATLFPHVNDVDIGKYEI